jgi:hypothetical protein
VRGELLISRASFAELKEQAKKKQLDNLTQFTTVYRTCDKRSEPINTIKVLANEAKTSYNTANKIIQINKLADAEAKEKRKGRMRFPAFLPFTFYRCP